MKEVESIKLVLINLEVVKFNREDIGILFINDVKRNIQRIASNSISEMLIAEEFYIQISSSANKSESYIEGYEKDLKPFDRLTRYKDITALIIEYQDGEKEEVYTKWVGDSNYKNPIQSSEVGLNTGDLYVVVSERNTAKSYFKDMVYEEESPHWGLFS